MAENESTNEPMINIDGKQYHPDDLSDTAKSQLANIRFVDKEIEQAKNQMAVLQAARQFYASVLSKELPESN